LGALSVLLGNSSISAASQISPLLIVLAFSAAKEAIEDFNRYRADTLANNTLLKIVVDGERKVVTSKELKPGDIVYVEKGAKFQVDCILLSSSYEDGTVFIETAELDGETNLKRKSTVNPTTFFRDDVTISNVKGVIECEQPNENLVSFEGRLTLDQSPTTSLSMLNMTPRGSVLRNTEFVYAVVVYAGLNTKIMKNLKLGKLKTSSLEKKLNTLVLYAFGYNAILLVSSVILEYTYYIYALSKESASDLLGFAWYIGFQTPTTLSHLYVTILSFFTLYTYVIPISLFVTIELVRLGQATYMVWDPKMKMDRENLDGSTTSVPMRVNNSNLNEELGCIDYIFSDKTGTLTQNVMKMDKWFVNGLILDEMNQPGVVANYIQNKEIDFQTRETMEKFLTALSVCHGVIPAWDEKTNKMIYESQSPDETALLVAAEQNSFCLKQRTKQFMLVESFGKPEKFEILTVIEFNSTRKRMSVVIRSADGEIILYSKGADNIMMDRLDRQKNNQDMIKKANDSLTEFSNVGLRTLVIAYRTLTSQEFEHFKKVYDEAECSLVDRDDRITDASDLVETGLTLLGCTAIEDRLQDNVPETIENLLNAGIKLWLLTGDKQETAINIGISSRLINRRMRLFTLDANSPTEAESQMDSMIQEMSQASKSQLFAMVVNGNVLSHVFAGQNTSKQKFLTIGKACKTVICSRVTPLQKALVVRLVKSSLTTSMTLAIGDGANDVSMIQEAHVGVGIMGKEGTQAVRAADFAFGEFQYLQRLLTFHGRHNYNRFSNLIMFSFYKNLVFISIQWFFGFVNMWSGQTVYEELFFISFNVIFTSIPPLVYALYERDVPEELIEKYPQLYREVKDGLFWNIKFIIRWFIVAICHTVVIFGVVYYFNYEGAIDAQGRSTGYWVQCYLLSTPLLVTVLFKKAIISRFWISLTFFGLLFSLAINVAIIFGLVLLDWYTYLDFQTSAIIHALPGYYLLLVFLPIACLVPDLVAE
jgi:phospholipid-transporting ATPase